MNPKLVISKIDWNEVVPLLPKDMRDSLYLEAVVMMAESDTAALTEEAPYSKNKTMRQRRNQYRKQNISKANGLERRYWRKLHPNESLVVSGRRFKINRDVKRRVQIGSAQGRAWTQLKESKNDYITTEGLYAIAKGNKIEGAQLVSNLWTHHQIDVEPATPATVE